MTSYIERANPNLIIILHYALKLSWLLLAALFAYIGYKLTLADIASGSAEIDFGGFKMSVGGASGLVLMVVALGCAVVGAINSKVVMRPDMVTLQQTAARPAPQHQEENREMAR